MQKKEIGVMYEIIRDRLKLQTDLSRIVMEGKINEILGSLYHVPKELRHIVIDELIQIGYLEGERKLQRRDRMFIVKS